MAKLVIRRLFAFVAFNVYSASLIGAFQINTPYQFDSEMIRRLQGTHIDSPNHWGWGNHYIWRLVAAVVATALAGTLTGAIARTRGGLATALSNIPSIAIWIGIAYYLEFESSSFVYGDQTITIHTGMIIVALIAIPLTTYVAFHAGEFGATLQRDEFEESTVFGIAWYHWAWLVIPVYLYAMASILPITNFLTFSFLTGDGLITSLINFALFVTAIASLLPLVWVYTRLKIPKKGLGQSSISAIINFGIIALGLIGVAAVQLASHWLLGKFTLL